MLMVVASAALAAPPCCSTAQLNKERLIAGRCAYRKETLTCDDGATREHCLKTCGLCVPCVGACGQTDGKASALDERYDTPHDAHWCTTYPRCEILGCCRTCHALLADLHPLQTPDVSASNRTTSSPWEGHSRVSETQTRASLDAGLGALAATRADQLEALDGQSRTNFRILYLASGMSLSRLPDECAATPSNLVIPSSQPMCAAGAHMCCWLVQVRHLHRHRKRWCTRFPLPCLSAQLDSRAFISTSRMVARRPLNGLRSTLRGGRRMPCTCSCARAPARRPFPALDDRGGAQCPLPGRA